ncbi:Pleiotropic negative transcriptional regulator [Sparganum proliferum]
MCILAELSERGSIEKPSAQKHGREELLLCTIDLDEHGALRVNPDFTKANEKHKITNNSGKAVFEYTFENCSDNMSDTDKQKEEFNLFEPCDGWLRIHLRGEIGWKSSSSAALSGCTQLASFVETTQGAFAYFSFPLEFDIAFGEEVYADKDENKTLKWPTLFMEILSMDIFTRCRTEGYAYTALPRCSGTHLVEVSAWRPVGQSIVSRLRRFFVGGTPQLEDPTFAMIPSDFQGSKLSKYGFRTNSAGSLFLRFYAIQQCWEFMEKQRPPLLRRLIVDKFAVDSHRLDTLTAIKMYQEARKKLLQARRGVQKQMKLYA